MAISSPGIGSGLDVNSIVSQLIAIDSQPLTRLNTKEASYQAKLSAFGNLKSALANFQSAQSTFSNLNQYNGIKGILSDSSYFGANLTNDATVGSHTISVTQLAQQQKLVSGGVLTNTAAVGNGTITISFGKITGGTFDSTTGKYTGSSFTPGTDGAKTITIDSKNSSLTGIKDAINSANAGVTAAIVNDGGTTPYHIVLTGANGGSVNSAKISVTGDAALQNLLNQDPAGTQNFKETAASKDALLNVDGIAITKTSNSISDILEGITLNLQKVTTSTTTTGGVSTTTDNPVTLTVSHDSAGLSSALTNFVKAYNDLNKTLSSLSSYDAKTQQAGTLLGDSTVQTIQAQVRGVLSNALTSPSGAYSTLSQVGINFQKDGSLTLDSTKLQTAIDNNVTDIPGLFGVLGKATATGVSYKGSTVNTKPGTYAVNVTKLATQGNIIGTKDNSGGVTITAGVNDVISVTIDGKTAAITLSAKTYANAADLVSEIQSKLNSSSALSSGGVSASVTQSGGVLEIQSKSYGSASKVSVTGTALTDLFGTSNTTDGVDVEGTIDGRAASGTGQVLTATSGDSNGLAITIATVTTGAQGTIKFARGFADQLSKLATTYLATGGALEGQVTGLNAQVSDVEKQKTNLNARLITLQAQYLAQFTKLDTLISSLKATQSFLTSQLSNLPTIGKPTGT